MSICKKPCSRYWMPFLLLSVAGYATAGSNLNYLALGDSVAYGLDLVKLLTAKPGSLTEQDFVGYPENVTSFERRLFPNKTITEVSAACPGETSGSFLDIKVLDYGCNTALPIPDALPFKQLPSLMHTSYSGSQMDFAISQLLKNKKINLVTLGIGANDALRYCSLGPTGLTVIDPTCVHTGFYDADGIDGIKTIYAANLRKILTGIRTVYHGDLILVLYYSPTPALNDIAQSLNQVALTVGRDFAVHFADGYTAFQLAALPYGGDVCRAGLLGQVPDGSGCDVHPSAKGQKVLAAAVEAVVQALRLLN